MQELILEMEGVKRSLKFLFEVNPSPTLAFGWFDFWNIYFDEFSWVFFNLHSRHI